MICSKCLRIITIIEDFLYERLTSITNSIGEIIHKSIMKFKLVVLGLKVINRSIRLIFTTLISEIIILPLGDYFDFSSNNLFWSPKCMYNIIIKVLWLNIAN